MWLTFGLLVVEEDDEAVVVTVSSSTELSHLPFSKGLVDPPSSSLRGWALVEIILIYRERNRGGCVRVRLVMLMIVVMMMMMIMDMDDTYLTGSLALLRGDQLNTSSSFPSPFVV